MQVKFVVTDSPVGKLILRGAGGKVIGLGFLGEKKIPEEAKNWIEAPRDFEHVVVQLSEYFAGTRREFSLSVSLQGTDFQISVYRELQKIPYGETRSYSEIANAIGNPKAVRAVGGANSKNPVAVLVPCHRVIGRDGSLTGFAGGVEVKRALLDLERGAEV